MKTTFNSNARQCTEENRCENKLKSESEEIPKLKTKLQRQENSFNSTIKKMEKEILKLIEKNRKLEKENSEQEILNNATINEMGQEIFQVKAQHGELITTNQNQSEKISELEIETDQSKEKISKLMQEIQDLQKHGQQLTTRNHNCTLENLELRNRSEIETKDFKDEITQLSSKIRDLENN
jgi:regulator of replication initiation timing